MPTDHHKLTRSPYRIISHRAFVTTTICIVYVHVVFSHISHHFCCAAHSLDMSRASVFSDIISSFYDQDICVLQYNRERNGRNFIKKTPTTFWPRYRRRRELLTRRDIQKRKKDRERERERGSEREGVAVSFSFASSATTVATLAFFEAGRCVLFFFCILVVSLSCVC